MSEQSTREVQYQRSVRRWGWMLVVARPVAFVAAQALIAGVLAIGGTPEPWWASAAWWPIAAVVANVAGFVLLRARARAEGITLRRLVFADGFRRRDAIGFAALLPLVAVAAFGVPWAWSYVVWGDAGFGASWLASTLPTWAALLALLAYPATMAAVDLPTYAYARSRVGGGVLATLALGAMLGLQHAALPFLPAWTFVEWRALMLVPYGVAVVALLGWRPRWLPWLVAAHAVVHALAAVPVWLAST